MWMSKLQLSKVFSNDSKVVGVNIEQPWQFDIVLGTLDTTVRTNFCFALETANVGLDSTQTTWAVYHTPKSSTCGHLAHVLQTGRTCYLHVESFGTICLLCSTPCSHANLSRNPLVTILGITLTEHGLFTQHS